MVHMEVDVPQAGDLTATINTETANVDTFKIKICGLSSDIALVLEQQQGSGSRRLPILPRRKRGRLQSLTWSGRYSSMPVKSTDSYAGASNFVLKYSAGTVSCAEFSDGNDVADGGS